MKALTLSQRLAVARVQKVPPGWFTTDELARRERVNPETARLWARQACASRPPIMERRDFVVLWGSTVRARPHFRYL